jgi:hypothetical protein
MRTQLETRIVVVDVDAIGASHLADTGMTIARSIRVPPEAERGYPIDL